MRPTLLFYSSCLTPEDFTRQGESAPAQWVNKPDNFKLSGFFSRLNKVSEQ
jgi:hypothetical protein